MVVINQNSSNSIELGNYYCERRQIPPENVLRVNWTGDNILWDANQFQTTLLNPLRQAVVARGISNQIHYVVLSMDLPYITSAEGTYNSTTTALFYGLRTNSLPSLQMLTNSYAASEAAFADTKPAATFGYSYLATMITANTLAEAKRIVDQGVDSDGTFPNSAVHLAKSSDALRRARVSLYENAVFNTRLRGNYRVVRTNSDSPYGLSGLLGYQTGLANFSISPNTFVPGAMADSLTSFAGIIFGNNAQTSLLAFLGAGAAGSYGTVTEPTATPSKFPNPQNYFYQARGFSLAECYYQSLQQPFQGLIVGEPLAAPFAKPGTGIWNSPAANATVSGNIPLSLEFTAADLTRPLGRVDLFVDGKFFQTLTNITPEAGNVIHLRVNGQNLAYTVPANATLSSLSAGLAGILNAPVVTNLTRTTASAFGDRVELRYFGTNRPAPATNLRISANGVSTNAVSDGPPFSVEMGSAAVQTVFITPARPNFLDSPNYGTRAAAASGTAQVGTWLRLSVTKTNGAVVSVAYTNQSAGANAAIVLSNLMNQVNAEPALQGPDGLYLDDFVTGVGAPTANFYVRSPGIRAAQIQVVFTSSGSLVGNPAVAGSVIGNLNDLQPRNHLYLTAGTPNLSVNTSFDTTQLTDGYHELTAVAYEGSHVRTQTRISRSVRVQNSPLTATMSLLNLSGTNSVSGNYSVQVVANATNIAAIELYSTGGLIAAASNQSSATFGISGSSLGVGRHPLYAVVQDTLGRRFRADSQWVRFITP